jgi:hypothetical protein
MEITAMPPTMPPAMAPAFELLPLGEDLDEEVAEMPEKAENEVTAGEVFTLVALLVLVVLEGL